MRRPRWQKVIADLVGNPTRSLLVVASVAVGLFALGLLDGLSLPEASALRALADGNLIEAERRASELAGIAALTLELELATLRTRVGGSHEGLSAAIVAARTATDEFAAWLRAEAPKKTGPSGIGKEQYTWFLQNVLLVPLSWEDEVAITKRELARAHASLRLEEPQPSPAAVEVADTPEAYAALQDRAIARYLKWVADQQILTIEPSVMAIVGVAAVLSVSSVDIVANRYEDNRDQRAQEEATGKMLARSDAAEPAPGSGRTEVAARQD